MAKWLLPSSVLLRGSGRSMIVTIDGPAGTGKSTAARQLAEALGFSFLDTGAMYRAVALKCLETDVPVTESIQVARLAKRCRIHFDGLRTILDGEDVTGRLRTAEVTEAASVVAQIPAVRSALVTRQLELARAGDTVSEGRDQGTVVFPGAECKFFLTAQPEERARRRQEELCARGVQVSFDELLRQQNERDLRDQQRPVAPLIPAPDAIIVDTTSLSAEQVLEVLIRTVRQKRRQ